ncbi:itaconyl-CoA hydratase [Cordyceps javanica]|uniref:Itaconyl-CoA hydratase n=1 Tax=Cordyceps javanica TaxID=43265 RepID=A0A545VF99_9HYPO|nr:itaconyl-CoA hydratase [Cordyceps javanica]
MSTRLGSALPRPGGGRHLQRLGRFQLVVRRPGPLSRDGTRLLPPALHLSQTIRRLSSTLVPPPRVKPDVERLRQQPAKIILDYLTPMPSHLLTTLLSDLEPCGADTSQGGAATLLRGPGPAESSPIVQSPPRSLPQGHHLVYFPIQSAPSHLAPDGADVDHSPGLHYSRRLWAGGEVVFRGIDGSRRQEGLVLDGRPWTCTETIGDVRVKESGPAQAEVRVGDKVFVDVWRRYALGHPANQESLPWSIEERRTLVFMNPGEIVDSRAPTASKTTLMKLPTAFTFCHLRDIYFTFLP